MGGMRDYIELTLKFRTLGEGSGLSRRDLEVFLALGCGYSSNSDLKRVTQISDRGLGLALRKISDLNFLESGLEKKGSLKRRYWLSEEGIKKYNSFIREVNGKLEENP